jgi:hypothetical protein
MKKLTELILIVIISLTNIEYCRATEVSFRWVRGFAMGTSEAIIRNSTGSSVNIYCPSGQEDTTPGLFVESKKVKARANENVYVQIIVDGTNFPFELKGSQFIAHARIAGETLRQLVVALSKSEYSSFKVEYPKYQVVDIFSLKDARKALVEDGNILDRCKL